MRTGIKAAKGTPRPEVVAALTASGGAPGQMVLAPDEAFRNQVLQSMPPMVLGKPKAEVVTAVSWAAASLNPPPAATGKVTIQAKNAAAEQTLSQVIVTGLMMAKQMKGQGVPANMDELVNALTPLPVGNNQLAVEVDTTKAVAVAKAMTPMFRQQQAVALRGKSASNIRQVLMAAAMYQAEHKGEWPEKLDDVKKYLKDAPVMTNPQQPERKNPFVYLKPKTPVKMPAQHVVMHESYDKFGEGINVGFADGHVEWIGQERRFKDLLLQTMEENSAEAF